MSPCKPLCRIALTLTLCALLAAWPGAAHALSGGPDGGGYVFSDSTETVSPPVWSWNDDISTTGTALTLPDDGARNVPIGFTFYYYGRGFTNAVVSSNGHIDFAEGFGNASLNFSGIGIPAPSNLDPLAGNGWGVNPLVAPWFDDFSPPDHGQVYYQTKGSLGSRRFIVQWQQVMHYDCKTNPPADYVTFQAVFYESTNYIDFKYLDAQTSCPGVSYGFEGTVGIALDEYTGLEYSLNTAALSNTLLVRFKPQGAATLSVEPSASVDFGDTLTGSTASRVVRLANTGLSMFDVISMNTVNPIAAPFAFGTDNCTGQLVAPGDSCAFTLMYSPTAAGASAESFDVQTTAGSATVSLIGNGVGTYTGPRMELEEDSSGFASDLQVEFGAMELTNSVSHTLTISNVGATSLVLGSVGLFDASGMFSASGSSCTTGLSIAPGGFAQCSMTLTFSPTALGPQEAILNVPSNDPAANPASIFLSGTGARAFEPDIAVIDTDVVQTDQIYSYGDVGILTSADAPFTVRNVGTDVLNISTVAVTDGLILPFSITSENCVGASLAPNHECTVTVRFAPTALGPYTDSFEVASDDPDEPSVTVAISGVGSAPPAPEITVIDEVIPVDDKTVPFGGITVGASATKVVTVRNDGTLPLNITGIGNVAEPFSRVTTCGATLAAGASCTVSVTFAPTETVQRSTTFDIQSNDSDEQTITVSLSGTGNPTGAPEITVTDAVGTADDLIMGFGDVVVGSSSTKNITVKNDGTLAMNIWSIGVTGTAFTKTTTCGATLAPGASCTVAVTFAPAATGFALESVSIASDDSNENPVTVFVSGTGIAAPAPNILVTDSIAPTTDLALPFGQVTLLSSSDQTVIVTNNGTATLTVAVSSLTLPFSIVTNGCNTGSVASGGSCTVVVRYRPTATGSHTGTLTITSNDADTPSAAIALSGSGLSAGAPEIQVTDSVTPADDLSVDFGTLVTGSSASKTVTVKNIGTSSLLITGVQPPAAPFTHVNTCPGTLAAGGSCTITVTYAPTTATTSISTVQISSSDTSENPVSVALVGTATAAPVPDISVTDSSAPSTDHAIAYGTVTQGQTATQTITVTNVGSVALTISGVSAPAAPFSISADGCSTQTLAAGANCVVTLAYAPTAVGQHSSSIAVTSNDPDSPSVSVALAGSGTALLLPDVVVTDDSGATTDHSIAFPMLTLPGTATASIYVRNSGTAEMTFTRTSPIAPFSIPADSCTSPIPVGASCTITVGYAPSASGTQTGSVTISTNDPDTPAVTVSLTGSAVPAGMPEITVLDEVAPTDDLSLDFGPVTLGTSLTRTITIRNDGTAALATTAISTPGAAFTPSHACAYASITPGATCTITMTFTPPSAGEFSSSISIGSNDATEDPVRVYLSGTGSQPPTPDISVTDSVAPATDLALIFGTLTTGQTASQSITVTNVGTALLTITGIIAPNSPFNISSNGCSSGTVAASSSCVMTVQFAPNVAGTFPGRLTVISNDPDEATVTYILTGTGVAAPVPDIGLTDSSGAATDHAIAFSQLETGQTATATVTVTNYGTATLTISAFTNPGAPFSVPTNLCASGSVAPNASCQITLQYAPTAAGTFEDSLSITSNDPDSTISTVTLTGTAILPGAPDITVTDAVSPATDLTMPFGDVTVGGSASLVITATNNGTRDLAVSGVTPPASPFSITANACTGATLAPTASCTLTVTFAPTGAGVNTSSLQIQSNDPDESGVTVYLSGTALAVLVPNIAATDSVAPATDLSVPYGTLTVGQSATQHVTLTNTGNTTLTLTGVTPPASPFSITANSCGGTLASGAACVISVTYSPIAPSVLDNATLTVASDDPDTATLTVNLGAAATAAPVPDVAVTDSIAPTSDNLLPFGSVTVGSSVAQTVVVTNKGTAALTITSITGPVATFGITANSCPASLAAGSSCMVTVQYAPAALGAHTGTVTVNTNDPDTATVAVALTGTGVAALAPEITVTDAVAPTDDLVMEFGSVTLGTSSSLAITVKNDGTSALTLTGVSLPAAPFSLSNSCPSSLAAGASCTLTVTLAPTATGTVTSSVSIGSNDSNENPVKVLLSGVGLAAPAPNIAATDSAAPANDLTVPFGTVTSGQSGTHIVTLTNSGTATLSITSISTLVAPFARTTDCGGTLAAGASCLVTVTYAPTGAPTTHTNTLSVESNDADTPVLNITLSGTSVAELVADASFTDSVAPATDSLVAFGTLTTGTSTTESITVANNGTASMTVAYSSMFAPFAVSGCAAGSVAVGSSCTLTVQYAPTVAGTHSGSITVDTNDPDSPTVSFSVTGSAIVPPVPQISVTDEVSPTSDHFVPFGDVTVSTTSTRTITVHNTGTALLTILGISSPAAPFSATNSCGATLAPGASCSLSVTFAPTASGFDFKALSIDSDATNAATVTVQLTGTGVAAPVPNIAVTDSVVPSGDKAILYGTLTAGQTSTQSVTASNTGTATLNISGITAPAAPFSVTADSCTGAALAPGANCTVSVMYAPTSASTHTGTLAINSDDPDTASVAVDLSGTSQAAAVADIAVADSSGSSSDLAVSYGTLTVNASATHTVTLTNNGTALLTLGYTSPSAPFLSGTTCGASLAAAGSCTFTVTYTPTAAGADADVLTITTNDPDTPTVTVSFTGTAVDALVPMVTVTDGTVPADDSTMAYGDVTVGTATTKAITVTNSGTAVLTIKGVTSPVAPFLLSSGCGTSLAPGASCTLTVTFAPTVAGLTLTNVAISTDAQNRPEAAVSVYGTGVDAPEPNVALTDSVIPANDSDMDYGTLTVGSAAEESVIVSNTGTSALSVAITTAPATPFGITSNSCAGGSVPVGAACVIRITYAPTAVGSHAGSITLATNDPDTPTITVTLTGSAQLTLVQDITVTDGVGQPSDGVMDFGAVTVGQTSQANITVASTGTATLAMGGVVHSSAHFTLTSGCGASVPAGTSCTIGVSYAPTATGTHNDTVLISSGDPDTSLVAINLSGQGTILPTPNVEVTDSIGASTDQAMDFGSVAVGTQSTPASVIVSNTGTGSTKLSIQQPSSPFQVVSGTNTCASGILAAGASCTFSVNYSPTASGTHLSTVTVGSDDQDSPTITVQLSGTATVQDVTVTVNAAVSTDHIVDFGSVAVGSTPATASVEVNSTGEAALTIISIIGPSAPFAITSNACAPGTLAAGLSCTINLNYAPVSYGIHNSTLTINTGDQDTPSVTMLLVGTPLVANAVVSDEIGDPDDLTMDFGNVAVNGSITNTITVTNNGTADLTVTLPEAKSPFTVRNYGCKDPVPQGEFCTFQVEFAPDKAGAIADNLILASNDPDSSVSITLKGTGDTTAPTAPVLVSPADGKTGLGTRVTFTWKKSVAVVGDTVKYDLYYSTDASFAGATTVTITNTTTTAGAAPSGARSWAAAALIFALPVFGLAAGISRRRMALAMLVIVIVIALGLMGCGNGIDPQQTTGPVVSQNVSTTVTSLQKGTVYYWKVKATGNNGASESEAWTFVTAL